MHRGRDYSRQDYGREDRSRSRDQSYGERSQGGHGGRGEGGYQGGRGGRSSGRGRGRHGGRGRQQNRPSSMLVRTNYFKIEVVKPTQMTQYQVSISRAKRAKHKDNSFDNNPDGSAKVVATKALGTNETGESSELTRRILQKLTEDLRRVSKIELVTDGSGSAYSNESFFSEDWKAFPVLVKQDCDGDDPDAELSKNARYIVKLLNVGQVELASNPEVLNLEKIRQSMDIIFRSALLTAGMKVSSQLFMVNANPETH